MSVYVLFIFGLMFGGSVVVPIAGIVLLKRSSRNHPLRMPRMERRLYPYILLSWILLQTGFASFIPVILSDPSIEDWSILLLLWPLLFIGINLYYMYRPISQRETLQNYGFDSDHCGGCEYVLIGNTSGVCPECGWRIPDRPMRLRNISWKKRLIPLWIIIFATSIILILVSLISS